MDVGSLFGRKAKPEVWLSMYKNNAHMTEMTEIYWNHKKHMAHAVCPTAACLGAGSKAGVWTVKIWDLDRFDT